VRCAVVGHTEWVEFVRVPKLPAAGEIVHASGTWAEPAGGGAVAARQLALLAGRCEFFAALGDDEIGRASSRRLAELGVDLHGQTTPGVPSRRAWTHVDAKGERTITLLSEKLHPHGPLPLGGYNVVFFTAGDVTVLFLPLAHTFGRLVHFCAPPTGFTIAFCPDVKRLAEALGS